MAYYDKDEIIRLFKDNGCGGAKPLMNPNHYHISTESLTFSYDGKTVNIDNVTFMAFNEEGDKVYFNDSPAYEISKMDGHFMFSTNPSEYLHPMVVAFYKMSKVIEAFGGTI